MQFKDRKQHVYRPNLFYVTVYFNLQLKETRIVLAIKIAIEALLKIMYIYRPSDTTTEIKEQDDDGGGIFIFFVARRPSVARQHPALQRQVYHTLLLSV